MIPVQHRVVGRPWSFGVYLQDSNGAPIDLDAVGAPVPQAYYYQSNIGQTVACIESNDRLQVIDAASGYVVVLLEAAVTQGALAINPAGILLPTPAAAIPQAPYPVRLEVFALDSRGITLADTLVPIQPYDPRIVDPSTLPAPSSIVVGVGPAGARGLPGNGVTINGKVPDVNDAITLAAADVGAIATAAIGQISGVAGLDGSTYVPLANLRLRRSQFLRALERSGTGNVQAIANALPANPGDFSRIAFEHEPFFEAGGTLYSFVKNTLVKTDAQMIALMQSAVSEVN